MSDAEKGLGEKLAFPKVSTNLVRNHYKDGCRFAYDSQKDAINSCSYIGLNESAVRFVEAKGEK